MIQFVTRAQVRNMIRDILEPEFGTVEFAAPDDDEPTLPGFSPDRADERVFTEPTVIELGDEDVVEEDDRSLTLSVLDRLERARR